MIMNKFFILCIVAACFHHVSCFSPMPAMSGTIGLRKSSSSAVVMQMGENNVARRTLLWGCAGTVLSSFLSPKQVLHPFFFHKTHEKTGCDEVLVAGLQPK
jgi:hypothetical protein